MDQKPQFMADDLRETLSVCELCDLYGIRRKTADKWIDRYLKHGPAGLHDRSRKPGSSPHHTPAHLIAALLQARSRQPTWGAKKRLPRLAKRFPAVELPSRTPVFDIRGRHGRLAQKRQRWRIGHPGAPTRTILAPHDVWSADCQGQFKTGAGRYGDPLTVTDGYRRYRRGCQALGSTAVHEATPVFLRLFTAFG
jgi:hypothetical protein